MTRWGDLDEIYERDYREMPEHETSDTPPDMRPPAINYEPADFDEQGGGGPLRGDGVVRVRGRDRGGPSLSSVRASAQERRRDMSERAHLFAALAKAQQAAKGIEKSGENKFHHYKYASAEDVVAGSRAALGAHALAFLSTSYKVGVRDGMLMLESRYLLTHESGESIEVESETPIIPDKGRPEDKATATAKTYDLAYALRSLLLLPRVEEGADVDSRDDTKYQPRERPSPTQIQEEARGPSKLEQWRNFWNEKLGAQLFADTVGVDVKQIHNYVLPKDKAKRDAVLATLESVRRDLDALSEVPA